MKKFLSGLLLSTCLLASTSELDRIISTKITNLKRADHRGAIAALSISEKRELLDQLDFALSIVRSGDQYGPRPPRSNGDWRRNQSYERNQVVAFSDDGCRNQIVEFRRGDNCGQLSVFNSKQIWSISINGQCVDTPDQNFRNSCDNLVDLAQAQRPRTQDLQVFSDDACRREITTIDPYVDAHALGAVLQGKQTWSIELNGTCVDVPDSAITPAVFEGYQEAVLASYETNGNRRSGEIEFFTDDSCRRKLVDIAPRSNCSALGKLLGGKQVWSVRMRGQCVDIRDTNFMNACSSYSVN